MSDERAGLLLIGGLIVFLVLLWVMIYRAEVEEEKRRKKRMRLYDDILDSSFRNSPLSNLLHSAWGKTPPKEPTVLKREDSNHLTGRGQ